jgi:predicted double-glycine peptidase
LPVCNPDGGFRYLKTVVLAFGVLLAAVLVSLPAAVAADRGERFRSLAEIRYERVVKQEWDLSCGAAALATLLTYDLGEPVTEREVVTGMLKRSDPVRIRTRGGFSLLNMQEYAESRGYVADGYGKVTMKDLAEMVPAIVPVQFNGYDHFVVVRQVRDADVEFADPAYGQRTVRAAAFEEAWKSRIAFVVRK